MKKFVATLLVSFIIVPAFAQVQQMSVSQNVFAPQWSDVCTHSAYWDIDVNKKYIKNEKKYWQERRIQFNKEILACEANSTDIKACYDEVIALETDRTAKWEVTYQDEKSDRMLKGGGIGTMITVLGAFVALARWW